MLIEKYGRVGGNLIFHLIVFGLVIGAMGGIVAGSRLIIGEVERWTEVVSPAVRYYDLSSRQQTALRQHLGKVPRDTPKFGVSYLTGCRECASLAKHLIAAMEAKGWPVATELNAPWPANMDASLEGVHVCVPDKKEPHPAAAKIIAALEKIEKPVTLNGREQDCEVVRNRDHPFAVYVGSEPR